MGLFSRREPEPAGARLATGTALICLVCANDLFVERSAQMILSESMIGFLVNGRTAVCRVCARCGFVHWFVRQKAPHLIRPPSG